MNEKNKLSDKWLLSALIIIGFILQAVAFAPPPPIPVFPPVPTGFEMFADVGFSSAEDQALNLMMNDNGEFEDCIALKVVNTFSNLIIMAQIHPSVDQSICEQWFVKLNEPGENQPYEAFSTSNVVKDPHMPGAFGDIVLCVKARDVDKNFKFYFQAGSTVRIAEVTLTMMPGF